MYIWSASLIWANSVLGAWIQRGTKQPQLSALARQGGTAPGRLRQGPKFKARLGCIATQNVFIKFVC